MTGFATNQEIFFMAIQALPKRWNECMERNGYCVEK